MSPVGSAAGGFPQKLMSALPPKADICTAQAHVCFGPIADMCIYANERAYSGARALRSGTSEILIRPLNGSFSSKIK